MFYGSPCQLRAALYIRTIGFKIVFRVIFFPLHLTDIIVFCVNFVSITFHLFLPFVSVTFRLFFYFSGCVMRHWCLFLSTVLHSSITFSVSSTYLIFYRFYRFLMFFVSVTQHPALTVFRLLVSSSWHSFFHFFFFRCQVLTLVLLLRSS